MVPSEVHHLDDIGELRTFLTRPVTSTPVISKPQKVVQPLGPCSIRVISGQQQQTTGTEANVNRQLNLP